MDRRLNPSGSRAIREVTPLRMKGHTPSQRNATKALKENAILAKVTEFRTPFRVTREGRAG